MLITGLKRIYRSLRLSRVAMVAIFVSLAFPAAAMDTVRLEDYQGKVVVLDFWASWCVPCRRSFPWMNGMQQKYGDDGLVVIAVNLDNHETDADEFLKKYPANFPIVYDLERNLAHDYDVQVMPSSFVIGRNGIIVENHLGFKTSKTDEYEAAIVAALLADQ